MQAPHSPPTIALAQGGAITDTALVRILPAARRASTHMTTELGEFMILTFAPIVEELLQRRRAMDLIHDVADPENMVRMYPGALSGEVAE